MTDVTRDHLRAHVLHLEGERHPALSPGRLLPESRLSDHSPFWDAGYPAVMVTDTAFLRNPHYHQPSDAVSTLDLGFLERVCRGVVELARSAE